MLRKLANNVPDRAGQVAVVEVALEQRLGETDYGRFVDAFARAETPAQMNEVLLKNWRTRLEPRIRPGPVMIDDASRKLEKAVAERGIIRDGVRSIGTAVETLRTIASLIGNHQSMRSLVEAALVEFDNARAQYHGSAQENLIAKLTSQVEDLARRNEALQRRNAVLERDLLAAQRSESVQKLNDAESKARPD